MFQLFPRVDVTDAETRAKVTSPGTQMLLALGRTGKHIYEGTVPAAEKATRRRRNKAARAARRSHRKASR